MKRNMIATTVATILLSCSLMVNAASTKPQITILATGGTIAGSAGSNTDTTTYEAGTIGVETLIKAVPEMKDVAVVTGEQVVNIASGNIDAATLLRLSKKTTALLNGKQDGVVITHGTDTIEETALFLDLTVKSPKPVVVVGAMRPATAISADGPVNLLNAVTLAASSAGRNRGTMMVLNNRIGSPLYMTKADSLMADAFRSGEAGNLGLFVAGQPRFYFTPAQPSNKPYFDISKLSSLPKVDILYSSQEQDGSLIEAAVKNGAKGIVVAGLGNGSIPLNVEPAVRKAIAQGVVVVFATRTGDGFVTSRELSMGSGFYNPQKARILLMLALAEKATPEQIRRYFGS